MSDENEDEISRDDLLHMTADIVSAYVSQNKIASNSVSGVINAVYSSLNGLGGAQGAAGGQAKKPAVPVKRSVTPDHIICLEDGKKLKMLKRYLRTAFQMTPEEYRAKWGLPPDYPMVAPNYAKQRSDFARQIGLGRKRGRGK